MTFQSAAATEANLMDAYRQTTIQYYMSAVSVSLQLSFGCINRNPSHAMTAHEACRSSKFPIRRQSTIALPNPLCFVSLRKPRYRRIHDNVLFSNIFDNSAAKTQVYATTGCVTDVSVRRS